MNNYYKIPITTREAIDNFRDRGREPGGFVRAILENNLESTIRRADVHNYEALKEIMNYVFNEIPGESWGDETKVEFWLAQKSNDWSTRERLPNCL